MKPLRNRGVAAAALITAALAATALSGCATGPAPVALLKDGELTVPADYKQWPRFLPTIDRADARQVRDIYMNTAATKARPGEPLPQGSRFVMEIYAAAAHPDGSLRKDAAGKLVKGPLLHVYLMGKEATWGQDVPEPVRNGNWIYAAYKPDGSANPALNGTCRGCHTPLKDKDYVFHLDRYFAERKAGLADAMRTAAAHEALGSRDAAALAVLAAR